MFICLSNIEYVCWPTKCYVYRCLAKFAIYPSGTHGADGKLRFHSDNPLTLMDGESKLSKSYYFSTNGVAIGNPKVNHFVWF